MLLRYDENGGFWATPGGSLEPGETPARPASANCARNSASATSTSARTWLPAPKTTRSAGRDVRQAEQYYLARVRPENVDLQSAASPDNIQEWRWSLAELTATSRIVFPAELTELLRGIIVSRSLPVPLTLE